MGARILEYGRFMHNFVADEPKPVAEVICERAGTLAGEYSSEKPLGMVLLTWFCPVPGQLTRVRLWGQNVAI